MIKKAIIITILLSLLTAPITLAQDSPVASPSGLPDDPIKQKLKERLEKTDGNSTLTANSPTQNDQSGTKWYSLFGVVSEATNSSILIELPDKTQAKISLDENSKLNLFQKNKSTKAVKLSDVKTGWFAIGLGTERINSTALKAKRVTLTPDNTPIPERQVVVGKITEIDESTMTLVNGKSNTISIPSQFANVKIKGVKKALMEQVGLNDKAMAVIETATQKNAKTKENETVYVLKALYVVPSISNAKSADTLNLPSTPSAAVASPSAGLLPTGSSVNKISPSPKATIKPSLSQTPKPSSTPSPKP